MDGALVDADVHDRVRRMLGILAASTIPLTSFIDQHGGVLRRAASALGFGGGDDAILAAASAAGYHTAQDLKDASGWIRTGFSRARSFFSPSDPPPHYVPRVSHSFSLRRPRFRVGRRYRPGIRSAFRHVRR